MAKRGGDGHVTDSNHLSTRADEPTSVNVATAATAPQTSCDTEAASAEADPPRIAEPDPDPEPGADEGHHEPEANLDESCAEDTADEADRLNTPESPARRRRWVRSVSAAAALVVVLASVGAAVFFGWQYQRQRAVNASGQAALDVARSYAVTLTSIDPGKIDQNFAAVIDGATGEFRDMYLKSSAHLRQLLIDNKAAANGVVIDSGVKSQTKNRVEVLLFVDQSVTNAANPEPRLDRSRIVMTMENVNGKWLAAKVDLP